MAGTYSISQVQSDLAGAFHGTTVNQITNLFGLMRRAGNQIMADLDPMETKRYMPISGTVFNGVWDYPVPVDLKGNKIIDLAPQVNRYPDDVWLQYYNQDFDRTKGLPWSQDMFTTIMNSGLKSIRINAPFFPAPIILDTCNAVNNWTNGGGATAPVVDNVNYVANGGSLMLNLNSGYATGNLSENLTTPINLSADLNQSTLFLYTYLPTPSAFTSVTLQFGSSSTNYYQVTTSVTQQNTSFVQGWNLLAFPWLGALVVGAPNSSSISYLNVIWNYNGTLQTAVRLDLITSNLGSILNCEYYSKYLFRTVAGVWQETVTDQTNLINLDTDSYNIYFNYLAHLCAQQLQGLDAMFYDGTFFLQKYTDGIATYKGEYKSEVEKPHTQYYKIKRGGYGNFQVGGRWNQ